MMEKFAVMNGLVPSEFRDLNHTRKAKILVSLLMPKFALDTAGERRRTSESGH